MVGSPSEEAAVGLVRLSKVIISKGEVEGSREESEITLEEDILRPFIKTLLLSSIDSDWFFRFSKAFTGAGCWFTFLLLSASSSTF